MKYVYMSVVNKLGNNNVKLSTCTLYIAKNICNYENVHLISPLYEPIDYLFYM